MARFLIEVPHEPDKNSCKQAIRVFKNTGSHFLTNADWGCSDDVHRSWIIIDSESKEEARMVVPPPFRDKAQIVTLKKFAFVEPDEAMDLHQ